MDDHVMLERPESSQGIICKGFCQSVGRWLFKPDVWRAGENPDADVRLGRTAMTDEMQTLCFMAGANSIFIGDTLLTATNPSEDKDHQLLRRLGMERTEARTLSASA